MNIDVGYFGVNGFLLDTKEGKIVNPPEMEVYDGAPDCCVM